MSPWEDLAACLGAVPNLFFPDDAVEDSGEAIYSDALKTCKGCPVRRACLIAGLAGREYRHGGMWGGADPAQLKRLARHTRHGRSPLYCEHCGTDRDYLDVIDIGWRPCCG